MERFGPDSSSLRRETYLKMKTLVAYSTDVSMFKFIRKADAAACVCSHSGMNLITFPSGLARGGDASLLGMQYYLGIFEKADTFWKSYQNQHISWEEWLFNRCSHLERGGVELINDLGASADSVPTLTE